MGIETKFKKLSERVRLVIEVMEDCLFDYSFESYKVPALNLHYFCFDYMITYSLVKNGDMQEGNMIPLNEEFEYIINNSIWLPKGITKSLFMIKDKNGIYKDISKDKNISTMQKAEYYNKTANCIEKLLDTNNNYIMMLIENIEKLLKNQTFDCSEKNEIIFCIKELICELINNGLSKSSIYNLIHKREFLQYYKKDEFDMLIEFLKNLVPKKEEYTVVFGITDETYKEFGDILRKIRTATNQEKDKLKANYVVETKQKSHDYFSALDDAKKGFGIIVEIYNASIHNNNLLITSNGFVKKGDEKPTFIKDNKNILQKARPKNKEYRRKWLKIAFDRDVPDEVIRAFSLHNNALGTNDAKTQLLTLWTIFELLIEYNNGPLSRVNYVANTLCSILCNSYYKNLLNELLLKIKAIPDAMSIVKSEDSGITDIEKLLNILINNASLRTELKDKLKRAPFLEYKVQKFENLFSTTKNVQEDLNRHSNRLRWQLMRIYKNRCMIVHDGTNLPYLNSITENLHYYVDELLRCFMEKIKEGITDSSAIIESARIEETDRICRLNNKEKDLYFIVK